MGKEEIAAKVKDIIMRADPGVDAEKIVPAAHLQDDLQLDSLDRMEITLALEDEINGDITNEEAGAWKTVADVQAFLEKVTA